MTLAGLIGKLAGFVGARFAGAGIGFVSQIALARLLPQSDVGTVLMGMSAAAFVSLATSGGYSLLGFTQVPKLVFHGRSRLMQAFHRVVFLDTLMWSALLFGLLFLASTIFNFSSSQNLAWLFGCICSPASSLMRYNSIVASSNKRVALSYVPDFLVRPGLFLLVLLLFAGLKVEATPTLVLLAFVGVTYLVTIGQVFILGDMALRVTSFEWPRRAFVSRIRFRALSLAIVSAVMLAFADIVTLTASILLPEHDVALVGVAMRLAAIAGFVLQAGQSFILPAFTDAVMKREQSQANAILLKLNLTTLFIILVALVCAIWLGGWLLRLFGGDYVDAAWLLVLLMIGQSLRALGGMNQHILSMEGQQLRTTGACLLALLTLFVSAYFFCKIYGFEGMGHAVILAEIVWLFALAYLAQKKVGRRGDLFWLLSQSK
jgi:O-antigen/teichoic acid export membrane protein